MLFKSMKSTDSNGGRSRRQECSETGALLGKSNSDDGNADADELLAGSVGINRNSYTI